MSIRFMPTLSRSLLKTSALLGLILALSALTWTTDAKDAVKKVAEIQGGDVFMDYKILTAILASNVLALITYLARTLWEAFHSDRKDLTKLIEKVTAIEAKLQNVPTNSEMKAVVLELLLKLDNKQRQ